MAPKARRCGRRQARCRGVGVGGDGIRVRVRGREREGMEAEVEGEAVGVPCCDVVGGVVERGMALAWPRRGERERGEERGREQGKRNPKGAAGFFRSAPLARSPTRQLLDSGALAFVFFSSFCPLLG